MSVQTAGAPPRGSLRYQNERDHKALVNAVAAGRITAEPDM